jgi:uracil-DNA glycosylase
VQQNLIEMTVPTLVSANPDHWLVHDSWQALLQSFWQEASGQNLVAFLRQRIGARAPIYPPQPLRALEVTPLNQIRCVILGQDPYHGPGQAEGLAFSVAPGNKIPPSLRNIFKELKQDLQLSAPKNGSLLPWAKKGVLLLNTCLTVEEGSPASHSKKGWEVLTDKIISAVIESNHETVFMLWGAHAQVKIQLIQSSAQQSGHRVHLLTANHPSPLSATRGPQPFLGCGHFSKAQKLAAIDFNLAE